jgi:pilus assembly protein CpaE
MKLPRRHRDPVETVIGAIPTVAVVSPKGGNGKTTVSSNLAVALSRRTESIIVDLDVHFGDVEYALRMQPTYRLDDLVIQRSERDPASMLSAHPSGLDVLCAPQDPVSADRLSTQDVFAVVDDLLRTNRPVVFDTAGGISDFSLEALDRATRVVLVCGTDVPSVQAAKKLLSTMDQLGMGLGHVDLLVNRSDSNVGLSVADVEAAVGRPAVLTVPEHSSLAAGMNSGSPVTESSPRSSIAVGFQSYADALLDLSAPAARNDRLETVR